MPCLSLAVLPTALLHRLLVWQAVASGNSAGGRALPAHGDSFHKNIHRAGPGAGAEARPGRSGPCLLCLMQGFNLAPGSPPGPCGRLRRGPRAPGRARRGGHGEAAAAPAPSPTRWRRRPGRPLPPSRARPPTTGQGTGGAEDPQPREKPAPLRST